MMPRGFVCLFAALLLAGCASVKYLPYEGSQQWKPGIGAFVNEKNGVLPVFSGPPPHPYIVIGVVTASDRRMRTHDLVRLAAEKAKKEGAQALVMGRVQRNYSGKAGNSASTADFDNQVTLVAIKWKP